VFAFHRDTFESGTPAQLTVNYQADGLDNFFRLSARRVGQGLLVSFSDTADADRTEVELALRASQTQTRAAQAEAERQRNQFQALVDQAPVALGFLEGPNLHVTAANQQLCAAWGHASDQILHRPLLEAVPELRGQGFDDLLRRVMATEVPFVGTETPARLLRDGQLTTTYYDFVYKPFYNAQGQVQGVIDVAVDVTAKVVARQQLEALTEELLTANQELEAVTIAVEQARADADLQRQQLHRVLQQAPAMICLFDGPQHTFQFVNPPYQALVGDRPLVGKPIAEAMPELAGQPIFDLLDQVYRTGETYYANEMLVQLDHDNAGAKELEKRYYNFIYQARYNLAGAIDGIFVFAYEVTKLVLARQEVEQLNEELAALNEELRASNTEYLTANTALQQAQQALQALNQELEGRVAERTRQVVTQRNRLERLVMEAPAAIAVLEGPTLVVELLNAEYEALFPDRELKGKPILEALPELITGPGAALLRQVYETGVTFEGREVLMHFARPGDKELEARYFDFIYQARYDMAGDINGLVLFGFDVTSRVQSRQQVQDLNEELAALNEELQASNEELQLTNRQLTRTNVDLDTFVYTASHDLKAPIANIESIVLALRDTLPTAVQQEVTHLLDLLDQTVTRFQGTIGQLTDISRLQLAHSGPAELVVLAPVVENVRLDLAPSLAAAQTQLTIEVPAELVVSFSPSNLRSIVYNLLSNAIKYRAPDRPAQVQLRAAQTDLGVVFTVQDNGLGMSEVQQRQLFGLFQRLHTHVEGTGVGLYITKRLVENGGGTIAVESQVDRGTTFTLTFPA
jgi:signal transduction histidine kinase